MQFRKKIQTNRIVNDKEIEKHMIKHSIELEGIKMIMKQFVGRKESKNDEMHT